MSTISYSNYGNPKCPVVKTRGRVCGKPIDRHVYNIDPNNPQWFLCFVCYEQVLKDMSAEEVELAEAGRQGSIERENEERQRREVEGCERVRQEFQQMKSPVHVQPLRRVTAPPPRCASLYPLSPALKKLRDQTPIDRRNDQYIVNWINQAIMEKNAAGALTQPRFNELINAMIDVPFEQRMVFYIAAIARALGVPVFTLDRPQNVHRLLRECHQYVPLRNVVPGIAQQPIVTEPGIDQNSVATERDYIDDDDSDLDDVSSPSSNSQPPSITLKQRRNDDMALDN